MPRRTTATAINRPTTTDIDDHIIARPTPTMVDLATMVGGTTDGIGTTIVTGENSRGTIMVRQRTGERPNRESVPLRSNRRLVSSRTAVTKTIHQPQCYFTG